jgi:hypothetical protein
MSVPQQTGVHNGKDIKQGVATTGNIRRTDVPHRTVKVNGRIANRQQQLISDGITATYGDNTKEFIMESTSTVCSVAVNRMQAVEQLTSSESADDAHAREGCQCGLFNGDVDGRYVRNRLIKQDSENTTFWAVEMMAFCRDATIVGLKNVVRPSTSRFRPIIWSLLILGGLAFTIYQSADRISYYLTWPTDVGVRVEYVDSLRFPMTTICNENRVSRRLAEAYGD